jgi:hypothetical protein
MYEWGTSGTLQAADRFLLPGFAALSATLAGQQGVPFTCTATRMVVVQSTTGGASTNTYELVLNGVNTGFLVTMSSAAAVASNIAGAVALVLGDRLALRVRTDIANAPSAIVIVTCERTT